MAFPQQSSRTQGKDVADDSPVSDNSSYDLENGNGELKPHDLEERFAHGEKTVDSPAQQDGTQSTLVEWNGSDDPESPQNL